MTELEKARRVIAKHEKEEAEKKRLKPGEVRYSWCGDDQYGWCYQIDPIDAALSPADVVRLIQAIPGIGAVKP